MPLIVTTSVIDAPPSRTVSADGHLAATADTIHGGVLLRADYSSSWNVTDTFNVGTSGWASNYDATVSRTTTDPISGTGSLLWTRDQAASSLVRTLPTFPVQPYEQKVVVYFTAKTTAAGPGVVLSVDFVSHAEVGIVTSDPRPFFATFYIPAGTTPDPLIYFGADPTNDSGVLDSGNVVLDDLVVTIQPPTGVYITRDGLPVRGASPSPASGGIAYAYDYEPTFGAAAIWSAQPVYSIRDTEVIAPASGNVSLVVPDLLGDYNMSLKSLNQPTLSRKVVGKWPAATRTWQGRNALTANPGASLSSGTWDVPVSGSETWVMETVTRQEALDMEDLLKSGPLLVQHAQGHRRSDMHALIDSVSLDYKRGPQWPEMLWTVAFVPIEQPTPVGAPLLIPGRSYGDLEKLGTYGNVASSLATYDAFLTPVTVQVGAGFGTTPFGTTAFGT